MNFECFMQEVYVFQYFIAMFCIANYPKYATRHPANRCKNKGLQS